jgi:hypothetical protein
MSSSDTENRLRDWRYGQVQAERLAAALLHIEGFRDVDPQHPLGGPHGLKDVLCKKDDLLWVAAAHFPPTRQSFPEIKTKFIHDLNGVSANGAQAFAFFVNQHLTAGERNDLTAQCSGLTAEIYHLERMCGLLNAPKGCGIRLEYLRIPMTEAEQWVFWSNMNADVIRVLVENEERHDIRLSRLDNKLDLILARTKALDDHLTAATSSARPRMVTVRKSRDADCVIDRQHSLLVASYCDRRPRLSRISARSAKGGSGVDRAEWILVANCRLRSAVAERACWLDIRFCGLVAPAPRRVARQD